MLADDMPLAMLDRIDAGPAAEHPMHGTLLANGFTPGYRGPTLRA